MLEGLGQETWLDDYMRRFITTRESGKISTQKKRTDERARRGVLIKRHILPPRHHTTVRYLDTTKRNTKVK